jgi:methylglutaconyl-CoA hydratase
MADVVELDVSPDGIAVVLLNRPERRNAFDETVIAAFRDIFETLSASDTVRVVFLKATGPSFCAGGDIEWMRRQGRQSQADNITDAEAMAEMFRALHNLPQHTVALVQGAAHGGGVGLVAACSDAVATADAQFRFSEVRLGLTPATISPFVVEAIGARAARRLFATGEPFDAETALRLGLIGEIVEDTEGLDAAMARIAENMLHTAPGAVADARQLAIDMAHRKIDASTSHDTARRIAARRASDEGREGLTAFLEKRKPAWRD